MRCIQILFLTCVGPISLAFGQSSYQPPNASADVVAGVPFSSGKPVGQKFRDRFIECDQHDKCDGVPLKFGCSKDRNRNTALLKLAGGVIFYDAKLGIDADGSPLARDNAGSTDQVDTSFRYPLAGSPSVNADRVPYVVIPLGGFGKELGVVPGDIAAVVYQEHLLYALVADLGPKCKIGEGSIELHEELGRKVCRNRNSKGDCTRLRDVGIDRDVLYFIFPGSKATIIEGLAPDNINQRLKTEGEKLMKALKTTHN